MDDFLIQFLSQMWRLILLILVMLGIAVFASYRSRKKAAEKRAERKEQANPNADKRQKSQQQRKPQKSRKQPQRDQVSDPQQQRPSPDAAQPVAKPQRSIFDDVDDDGLFPDESPEDFVQPVITPEAPSNAVDAQVASSNLSPEDDVVDLASLLTGMVEDPEPEKDYHRIASDPVAVKLVSKRKAIAQELLTILRDKRDSRLMVQMGDVAYRTLENDLQAKKQFATTMQELSGLIRNPDPNPPQDADVSGYSANKMVADWINVQVASGGDTQAREMISILRDQADGHLIIQIGNTGYRALAQHERAKAGFAKIMKELAQAVATPDDNPPVVPSQSKPSKTSSNSTFAAVNIDDDDPLPGDINLPSIDELPDSYSVGRFGRVKVNKLKLEDKVEPKSIAEAIEEYLQFKISQTPQFQGRGIHIRQGFGGGVRIEVDGQSYEFVDEVADPQAQSFIKQAIDEWQERH